MTYRLLYELSWACIDIRDTALDHRTIAWDIPRLCENRYCIEKRGGRLIRNMYTCNLSDYLPTFPCPLCCPAVPGIMFNCPPMRSQSGFRDVTMPVCCVFCPPSCREFWLPLYRRVVFTALVKDCRAWRKPRSLARGDAAVVPG